MDPERGELRRITPEERKEAFINAIKRVMARDEFPSGARIQRELGRNHSALNTEQTRWRREYLLSLGWTRGPRLYDRWKAPA